MNLYTGTDNKHIVEFEGKTYNYGNGSLFTQGYTDSYYRRAPRVALGEEYLAGYRFNETVDFNFKDYGHEKDSR